ADAGASELEANVDSLIVVLNEKLLEVLGDDVTQEQAFAHANDVLKNAVGGISDIIHMDALVNVDFEDVKTVMSEPGKAMMGTATATGPDRATKAAEAAVACPLLEGIDLSGARGVLVLIAASKSTFKLKESQAAMNCIRRYASDDAHIIYGAAMDEGLGDQLRVTVIATGLSAQGKRQTAPLSVVQTPVLRTGTDNLPVLNTPVASAPVMQAGSPGAPSGLPTMTANPVHDPLQVPSVWRSGRTAATAKVDALANHGMDEIEIPAFLRKQAD
ncbi:MAG: cell division protein FtsZ, partial [Rhodoferax sp.]|nr:cell division protein FtsZ [Rhodoferax sp.]